MLKINRIDLIRDRLHPLRRQRQRLCRQYSHKTSLLIPATSTLPAKADAVSMRAERSITITPEPRDVYKVAQWKWNIDEGSPRWKQLFFKYVFLPFQSFSFKLGVPTPKEVVVEYDEQRRIVQRTFRWWEDEGIFDDPDQADAGCLAEHWGYTNLPHGRLMPSESGTYGVTIFPRKQRPKQSHQWAKPRSVFVIKDRKQEERQQQTLAEYIAQLHRVLDQ